MYTPEDVKKAVKCFQGAWVNSGEAISSFGRLQNSSVEELFAKILSKRVLVDRYIYWSGASRALKAVGIEVYMGNFSAYKQGDLSCGATEEAQAFLQDVFVKLSGLGNNKKLEDYL